MKWGLFKEYCECIFTVFNNVLRQYPPEKHGRRAMLIMERMTGIYLFTKASDNDVSSMNLGIYEIIDAFSQIDYGNLSV
jgi:hypothetical protein